MGPATSRRSWRVSTSLNTAAYECGHLARAKDLLADAIARPESERDAFLQQACHDPALLAEVRTLLAHYTLGFLTDVLTAGHWFDAMAAADGSPDEDLPPGTFIGHYAGVIVRPVVAVLPLENLSGDPAKQYLGAGVAETLAMALSKVRQLTVISGAEAQAAVHNGREPRQLAKVLGASFLVDGSVQQVGDRLRIALKLLRRDGGVEWTDAYEDSIAAIFNLQQSMATALVRELQGKTNAGSRLDFTIPSTSSPTDAPA